MKNFLRNIFRQLWKQRLFTTLNVFGLAVSISACWIIYRIANYEFSYDKNLPGRGNIYRVVSRFMWDEKESFNGGVSAPLYQEARHSANGLKNIVPVIGKWITAVQINDGSANPKVIDSPKDIVGVDSSYFNMLNYHWLAGNKISSLKASENVILTESRAKQYFPGKSPEEILNKTITYFSYLDTVTRKVSGIVADFQVPTEFTAQEFCKLSDKAYELSEWTNTNGSDKLYVQLKPDASTKAVLKNLQNLVDVKSKEFMSSQDEPFEFDRKLQLMPLSESHFSTYIQEYNVRKASKPVILGLIGVALFLIILAGINYINLSVASIPGRAKEIGVRKTLGSGQTRLIFQILTETLFTTLLAGILSFPFSWLGFYFLNDIIPVEITPFSNIIQLVGFITVVALFITVIAGIYPAWLVTKVKAVNIFRGVGFQTKTGQRFSLQKILIVFQFVIALVFITSAIFVGKQLHYALTTDMGFDKDAVVLVDVPWKIANKKEYHDKQFALATELKRIPGVQNVALGANPMTNDFSSSQYEYLPDGKEPVKRQVFKKWVDTAYLKLYNIKLIAGRNIHASDTTNEFVINETAVKAFGFASPQDALGKVIGQQGSKFPIVGVVKDFHLQNFYQSIDPMAFESDKGNLLSLNIKLAGKNPEQWQKTLKAIEKEWYKFYPPESYSFKFYDEMLASMYEKERHLAKLIDLATLVSIFISCLGLFGLAVLTAFQRTKEIGVRKVLGASVSGIIQLLSKEYIKLVIIAFLIASPIVWWVMDIWLRDFVYRISLEWWVFATAGSLAVLVAFITVSFQAVKAALANPIKSLRTE